MLADGLQRARRRKRDVRKGVTFIDFARKGEKATGNADACVILSSASDWQMQVDILVQGRAIFPHEIAVIVVMIC